MVEAVIMDKLTQFNFNEMDVRVVMQGEDPWFVAKDTCRILEIGNPSQAICGLDDDEKGITTIETLGGLQDLSIINESGLYSLIMRSRKPAAKQFKKWVTSKVLPSIRKRGMYATPDVAAQMIADPAFGIKLLQELQTERDARIEAERTKAMIGSKREASAMGRASAEARKRKKLEDEIGRGAEYRTAVNIPWLGEYFNLTSVAYQQIGKQLTKISRELNQDCPMTTDPALSRQVKRYHRAVISAFKWKLDTVSSVLEKYRK
jgi:prophage antirepressor-like protein